MEYNRFHQGTVTSLGGATPVILPFLPNWITILNSTRTSAASGVNQASWQETMGQGAAFVNTVGVPSVITTGGFSTFYAGLSLQYGPVVNISTITAANPAVVTTATAHGLVTGNVVIFQSLIQSATTGMQQLASIPFVVTVTGTTTFTIPYNTSLGAFTAYNSGTATAQATVKQVLYPTLYFPSMKFISAITLGATTTVTTTTPHNYVVGQQVAFRIPSLWGTTQLNSLPNTVIPGSPLYGFVIAVPSTTSVVVNINSTGYTAFTTPAVSQLTGLSFPQIVAVGDNNTGSLLFGFSSLTINGPTISGAFQNNTSQGFIIGPSIAGTAADTIYWQAGIATYSNRTLQQTII